MLSTEVIISGSIWICDLDRSGWLICFHGPVALVVIFETIRPNMALLYFRSVFSDSRCDQNGIVIVIVIVIGFVTLTQMNQNCRPYPRSSSNNLMPFGERLGARLMESSAGDQMAL
jgi:hypothetical protein